MILKNLLLIRLHMLHILHVIIGERHSIRTMRHLEVISLNGLLLSRLEPVLLAPVADLSE